MTMNLRDSRLAVDRSYNLFPETYHVGQVFGRNSENTVSRIEENWLQAGTNFTTVYFTCPHTAQDLGRPGNYEFAVGIRKNQVK